MNCPGSSCKIYKQAGSYKGCRCAAASSAPATRNESGSLHGIMRVRGFTCRTMAIFVTEDQIQPGMTRLHATAAKGIRRLSALPTSSVQDGSTRPGKSASAPEVSWDRAEHAVARSTRLARLGER